MNAKEYKYRKELLEIDNRLSAAALELHRAQKIYDRLEQERLTFVKSYYGYL